jgi:hypothetical protein
VSAARDKNSGEDPLMLQLEERLSRMIADLGAMAGRPS